MHTIPRYVAGTWNIDPVHSGIGFTARHMMISKVRGRFAAFEGSITTAENPLESTTVATIDLTSITTGNEQRDGHLRSADFFNADSDPKMTYRSTGIRENGDGLLVDGELTIRGITRPVTLDVEVHGIGVDNYGGTRLGCSATGEINRTDFGMSWNVVLEGGGYLVSEKIRLTLDVEAVLRR
jgi:polyisoprenoid-binding protein YceI